MAVRLLSLPDATIAVTGTPQSLLTAPYPQNVVKLRIQPLAGIIYVGGSTLDQGNNITGVKLDADGTTGPQHYDLYFDGNQLDIDSLKVEGTATNRVALLAYIKNA